MKIAVCMKQVPAYSDGNMDEKTGLMIRSGLASVVNVYDIAALETALQIRDKTGGTIDVYTMGPDRAVSVLREAYAYGADRGYLISDTAFGGADVLATSYTLMQAIKSQDDYDVILCGKQTTDGDTGQVGGALAKWLEIPHFTGITNLIDVKLKEIHIEQAFEHYNIFLKIPLPCLLAVEREIFVPRMPSLKLRMEGKKKEVKVISLKDLPDKEPMHYGLKGSATKVVKIFPPERTKRQEAVSMEGKEAASFILEMVRMIQGKGMDHEDG